MKHLKQNENLNNSLTKKEIRLVMDIMNFSLKINKNNINEFINLINKFQSNNFYNKNLDNTKLNFRFTTNYNVIATLAYIEILNYLNKLRNSKQKQIVQNLLFSKINKNKLDK